MITFNGSHRGRHSIDLFNVTFRIRRLPCTPGDLLAPDTVLFKEFNEFKERSSVFICVSGGVAQRRCIIVNMVY